MDGYQIIGLSGNQGEENQRIRILGTMLPDALITYFPDLWVIFYPKYVNFYMFKSR